MLPSRLNCRTFVEGSWAGTESSRHETAPEIVTAEKADLGQEIFLDQEMIELQAVAVGRVVERAVMAHVLVAVVRAGSPGPGKVGDDVQVLEEGEGAVDAVGLTGSRSHPGDGPVRQHRADRASPQEVAPEADDGEIGRVGAGHHLVTGLNVHGADVELTNLAGDPRATHDGYDAALFQTDLPAVEELRHVDVAEDPADRASARTADPACDAAPCEVEDARYAR